MLLLIAVAPRIVIIHSMIQIHLMLLLIAAKDYKKLVEEYHSNTSHVTINPACPITRYFVRLYSNTSHVTINQQESCHGGLGMTIQIHLMLLLIAHWTRLRMPLCHSNTSHVTINRFGVASQTLTL